MGSYQILAAENVEIVERGLIDIIVMDKIRVVWYNMRHETQAIYAH